MRVGFVVVSNGACFTLQAMLLDGITAHVAPISWREQIIDLIV